MENEDSENLKNIKKVKVVNKENIEGTKEEITKLKQKEVSTKHEEELTKLKQKEVSEKPEEEEELDEEEEEQYLKENAIHGLDTIRVGELNCYYPSKKTGEYKVVISTHYQIYLIGTLMMILLNIIFHYRYRKYIDDDVRKIAILLYLISLVASIKFFFSNPSIPLVKGDKIESLPKDKKDFCHKCRCWRDSEKLYLHCNLCRCCIEWKDKHSMFFGKCIGQNNYISYNVYYVTHMLTFAFMIFEAGINAKKYK